MRRFGKVRVPVPQAAALRCAA